MGCGAKERKKERLDGGKWSASRSGRFTPWVTAPGTYWIGGWVGRRAGLNAVVKRKIPSPCRDLNPPIIQPGAQRYTTELSRLLLKSERFLLKKRGVESFVFVSLQRICQRRVVILLLRQSQREIFKILAAYLIMRVSFVILRFKCLI
jgi:hypothetical protein